MRKFLLALVIGCLLPCLYVLGSGGSVSPILEGTSILSSGEVGSLVLTSDAVGGSSWAAVAGTGDVVGPVSSVSGHVCSYDGITGKIIKDGGAVNIDGVIYSGATSLTPGSLAIYATVPSMTGNSNIVIGGSAGNSITTATESTIIGSEAGRFLVNGNSNTLFGHKAGRNLTSAAATVSIGHNSGGSGAASSTVSIGANTGLSSTGIANIFIGKESGRGKTGNNNVHIMGNRDFGVEGVSGSSAAASGELVFGSALTPLTVGFFGEGAKSATPGAFLLRGTFAVGTDISAGDLSLAAGAGSGLGVGGSLKLQTAGPGLTGSTVNPLVTRIEVTHDGIVDFTGSTLKDVEISSGPLALTQNLGGVEIETVNAFTMDITGTIPGSGMDVNQRTADADRTDSVWQRIYADASSLYYRGWNSNSQRWESGLFGGVISPVWHVMGDLVSPVMVMNPDQTVTIEALTYGEQTVSLVGDDQLVTAVSSMLLVSSDNATSTLRTMALQNGTRNGQVLTIISDTPTNAWELQDTGNQCLSGLFTPADNDSISLVWNSTTACWHEAR